MCSIPGLPTPGSEVPVIITRVHLNPSSGLVELWVNMDDGKKHIYEQMREDIQIPKRKFNGSEGKPGDLCLVCISDTWHRARIVSTQNKTYNVFLIDQGQPHITTGEDLAWGQCDSVLLPPEIESCILTNVLSFSERAAEYLKSVLGKKFKALVQHVLMPDRIILLDIPLVSKNMCKTGVAKKIPMDEFKCLVRKCLHLPKGKELEAFRVTQEQNLNVTYQLEKHDQYFYPELLTHIFENVNVTEVINPQHVFCKLQIFSKAVKILSNQIHQHYEESGILEEAQPQSCGDPCAARGLNGRWHRSLLKQNMTSDGAVEVLHVDEGKTEFIPVGDIKPLHGKFLRMPVFTYPCSLDGVKDEGTEWTTHQIEYLKSLLLHKTVSARFHHHYISEDVYHVTLYADNALSINSCFMEKAGLIPASEQVSNVQNESIPLSIHSHEDKQCMDVQSKLNVNVEEETLPGTKNLPINARTDDTVTDYIHAKDGSKHQETLLPSNEHLSAGFPYEVQDTHDGHVLTVGSSVNVSISCIESLQKFWCQTTENASSLTLLMQDLQTHYAFVHPQPLVESVCVARNPNNKMWYRARIIASDNSPVVDVRFIDYGQTQKVPLRDVRPIDPTFLRLNAQAFQCCLYNLKNPTNPTAITWTDSALREFQKFVDLGASSNVELKCIVKAVMSDEEGLLLNVVDIETPADSACKLLDQRCALAEAQAQIPPQVPSDVYSYSTFSIEEGGKEKVWVTFSENVHHFYCQLDRNSHIYAKVMKNIQQLIGQQQCSDHPLGLDSICLARYNDNQWYRGQVVEMSPKLKVHFVDYGNTLAVSESDICPFPIKASITASVPVQAVPLGLFDVPEEVPEEVNQWFSDHAIGNNFTISVVKKGVKGKLIVELYEGCLNVNMKVQQMISQMIKQKTTSLVPETEQQLSKSSEQACVPNGDCLTQEFMNESTSTKMTKQNKASSNGTSAGDVLQLSSQSISDGSSPEGQHVETLDEGGKATLDVALEEIVLTETFIQSDSEVTQLSFHSCPVGNVKTCTYKSPNISLNKTEEVYTSCIAGPHYFWCQYTNTEDLNIVSRLAQERGQGQQDVLFHEMLGPGNPCLALFSSDNQWYRGQVIQRTDNTLNVLFIDYGNESEVNIKDVRPLPQSLLDTPPQAFLCCLKGFDESKGSWDDNVYDDFYNLLVDKPLKVTVFNMVKHSEIAVPQCAVQIECENMVVNDSMLKYWKPVDREHALTENPETENLDQGSQTESYTAHLHVSRGNASTRVYKNPSISRNTKEDVYASCIAGPEYFWCQYTNTEDLNMVSRLAQEAGQAQQDILFSKMLDPGSPCLALFSSDNQWYRAQVTQRTDDILNVVFIDYGNESDVDMKNVRPLPQSLLDVSPQAFLCSLNGFDESRGSWVDEVYDDFHSLLVDKPLKLTVVNIEDHSLTTFPQYSVEIQCEGVIVNAAMRKYWKPVVKEHVLTESPRRENLQDGQTQSNMGHVSVSRENTNTCTSKKPESETEMVYASCIAEPHFFWCQYANTEELNKLSSLAQEAGQVPHDMTFPKTLTLGSSCLALFSDDKQWYRAQVICRVDDTFRVVFIDYGNESDVDIKDVRPIPRSLLDKAPQAFLCSLNGFDKSTGSWVDEAYEDFYNLLIDKPLKITVFNMDNHVEIEVPQYAVQIECEGVEVNTLMEKYWRGLDTENALAESVGSAVDPDTRPCGNPVVTERC